MERVAVYVRLSKEDINKISKGDDSESIKNQKLMLSDYATRSGWQIYDFYVDEDYSGADRARPDFERLLKDAENKEFDIVLCKSQSRFVRDLEKLEEIIHGNFYKWGIRFVSLLDGADTSIIGNKKSRQIHGLVDEWYLEDLSNNIRSVFKVKMKKGQFLGSFPPYGYMKDPRDRYRLIIDEETANNIKKIYSLYLKGYGTHSIAKILTEEGIEKPSIYMKRKYKNFSLPNVSEYSLWGHTTINRILRNPIYIGNLVQGKETTVSYKNKTRVAKDKSEWIVVENSHDAIISKKDFYEVQRLLDSKRRVKKREEKTHIFATKVRCLHCGGSMIRTSTRTRKYEDLMTYAYLKCKNNTLGGNLVCNYKNRINYVDLYEYVEAEFVKVMGIYKNNQIATEATLNRIKRIDYNEEIKKIFVIISNTETDLKSKAKALTDLYIDKSKGVISDEDYTTISFTIKEESRVLEKRKDTARKKLEEINKIINEKADLEKVVDEYLKAHKLTHEIVNEIIDYIEIGSPQDGQNRIINIYWKL
ncbi:MAG: recombinase family protein [Tissierellaceae bacterium]